MQEIAPNGSLERNDPINTLDPVPERSKFIALQTCNAMN
jgi:hypothetical protein